MLRAVDVQLLVAGHVIQTELVAGQHAGQVAIFFLVHVGAGEGVLRRVDGQVAAGLDGEVAGAGQGRAGDGGIAFGRDGDRFAGDHAAHGGGAFFVDVVLDLARLQAAPAAFAFLAFVTGAVGIADGEDIHVLAGDQLGGAFFGGDGTAGQQQVCTGDDGAVRPRTDQAANVVHYIGFIQAEFFALGGFLGLAVEAVVLVFGAAQAEVFAGYQVRLVAGIDLAGHQLQVLPGAQGGVAAGLDHAGHLLHVVFDAFDFFRVVRRMLLVGCRDGVEVAGGNQVDVALGFDLAGHGADVAPGDHMQVAAGFDHGALLGDGGEVRTAADVAAAQGLRGGDVDVAFGLGGGVGAAFEHAAYVVDVAAGLQGEGVGRFDAGGVVDEVAAFGAVVAGAFVGGDGALVEQLGTGGEVDIATDDHATGAVAQVITAEQVEAPAGFHQAAVGQVAASTGEQAAGGAQGADVVEVGAGHQAEVAAGNQCAVGGQAVVGLGQVQHGHQYWLAGDGSVFQPDDVVGQGGDLFGGEADAYRQVERGFAADGVVHQVLEQVGVAGLAVDEALAGAGKDGLLDQALFVEAVAQALLRGVGVVAELGQQVIRTQELTHVGQRRVGFDQVLMRARRELAGGQAVDAVAIVEVEQAVLPGGQTKAGQAQRVDLLLGNIRRQLRVEADQGGVTRCAGVGFDTAAHVGVTAAYNAVVDTGLGPHIDRTTGLDHGAIALVRGCQLSRLEVAPFAFHGADKSSHGSFDAAHVLRIVIRAADRIALAKGSGRPGPDFRVATALGGEDAFAEGVVGHQAHVGQLVDGGGQIAARCDATAAVEQRSTSEQHVGAGGDARGRAGLRDNQVLTLGNQVRTVFLAAVAVAAGDVEDAGRGRDGRAVDTRFAGQHRADILDRARREDQAGVGLDRG